MNGGIDTNGNPRPLLVDVLGRPIISPESQIGGGQALYEAVVDAAGDGDYTTLASALAAGKKSIFIRNGTYVVSSTINVTNDYTYIRGESKNVIFNFSTATTGIDITGYGVTIEGLVLNGHATMTKMIDVKNKRVHIFNNNINGVGGTNGVGIKINDWYAKVQNNLIEACLGYSIEVSPLSSFFHLEGNYLKRSSSGDGGIKIKWIRGKVINNTFEDFQSGSVKRAISLETTDYGLPVGYINFSGNNFETCTHCIYATTETRNLQIANNHFNNCGSGGYSLYLNGQSDDNVIEINICDDTTHGFYFSNINNSLINNNKIFGRKTLEGGSGVAVNVADGDRNDISHNQIHDFPNGVVIGAATAQANQVVHNIFSSVTTSLTDSGTGTIT